MHHHIANGIVGNSKKEKHHGDGHIMEEIDKIPYGETIG